MRLQHLPSQIQANAEIQVIQELCDGPNQCQTFLGFSIFQVFYSSTELSNTTSFYIRWI